MGGGGNVVLISDHDQEPGEDIEQSDGGDDEVEPDKEVESESEGFVVSDGHLSEDEGADDVAAAKYVVIIIISCQ